MEEGICSEFVWRRYVLKGEFFGRDNFVILGSTRPCSDGVDQDCGRWESKCKARGVRRIVDSEIKAINNVWIRYVLEEFYCRAMLMRMNRSFTKELFDEALREGREEPDWLKE